MKMPKMRRETAKELTAIAAVLSYVSSFLYSVVTTDASGAPIFGELASEFGVVGGIIATFFGASGAQHVAREHVRRQEKKDAAEAGDDDGAGDLHLSEDEPIEG